MKANSIYADALKRETDGRSITTLMVLFLKKLDWVLFGGKKKKRIVFMHFNPIHRYNVEILFLKEDVLVW